MQVLCQRLLRFRITVVSATVACIRWCCIESQNRGSHAGFTLDMHLLSHTLISIVFVGMYAHQPGRRMYSTTVSDTMQTLCYFRKRHLWQLPTYQHVYVPTAIVFFMTRLKIMPKYCPICMCRQSMRAYMPMGRLI